MLRIVLTFVLLWVGTVHAHKSSDSYLALDVQETHVNGQWDIALRDLEYAIGLDNDDDGAISWGELRAHHDDITAFALAGLRLKSNGETCAIRNQQQLVDNHSDGAYAVLRFTSDCPSAVRKLEVTYQLFFDLDPQHRGLLRLSHGDTNHSAIFGPDQTTKKFDLASASLIQQFLDYAGLGIWHISVGFDHILFLLALLLPSVFYRTSGRWQAVPNLHQALWDVLKIVTAFTLAHSITLSLTTLEFISLPSRWVESAIAISIILAALNNVYSIFQKYRWVIAFVFGLIHGMGFASALADSGLIEYSLWLALLAFNLGVEAGQLIIVGIFLPLAYWLRSSNHYQRLVLNAGSVLIAAMGLMWLLERSLEIKF